MHHGSKDHGGIMDKLIRSFPPPESLSLSHSGIDITQGAARFLALGGDRAAARIKASGEISMPLLSDDMDKKAEEEVVRAIAQAREEIGRSEVRVMIPEEEVYVFRITLPRLASKREMGSAVELQLEESVPLAPADTLFEFDIIGSPRPEEATLSVSAVPRAAVERILSLLERGGFMPVEANTEGRCLARSLTNKSNKVPVLIVSIQRANTVFVIAKEGKVLFSSTSPVGRETFINAIAKSMKLSPEAAEGARKKKLKSSHEDNTEFFESIAPAASVLQDEIGRIIAYWKTHGVGKERWEPLSEIVLSGSDALLPGLMNYLGGNVDLPVRVGDVWQNVFVVEEYTPTITHVESLDYASLSGLVI